MHEGEGGLKPGAQAMQKTRLWPPGLTRESFLDVNENHLLISDLDLMMGQAGHAY
jgi:hypothetical protein